MPWNVSVRTKAPAINRRGFAWARLFEQPRRYTLSFAGCVHYPRRWCGSGRFSPSASGCGGRGWSAGCSAVRFRGDARCRVGTQHFGGRRRLVPRAAVLQRAARGPRRGAPRPGTHGAADPRRRLDKSDEPADHAIGRSRGGLTTKTHALVDGHGRPLVLIVSPGQAGDSPVLPMLLDELSVPRRGPGRPRTRPEDVRGDKAYSSRGHRSLLRSRRIAAVIPERADQVGHRKNRGSHGGRPVGYDIEDYKNRRQDPRAAAAPPAAAPPPTSSLRPLVSATSVTPGPRSSCDRP